MSDKSPLLSLPYIQPAQAQKHVTHNEALSILDAVAQLAVISRNLSLPPAAPAEGDRHIVASSASGAWAGQEGGIALFDAGDWSFLRPLEGWRAFVLDECVMVTYRDAAWQDDADLRYLISELGVNAMPDPINRLSVVTARLRPPA